MLSLIAAAAITATTPPALTPAQGNALRCAVVFARGARMQADGAPLAAGWPALGTRGREYFVRVAAKLMDETGRTRVDIAALAAAQPDLADAGAVAAAMPGCLPLLAAAGL